MKEISPFRMKLAKIMGHPTGNRRLTPSGTALPGKPNLIVHASIVLPVHIITVLASSAGLEALATSEPPAAVLIPKLWSAG